MQAEERSEVRDDEAQLALRGGEEEGRAAPPNGLVPTPGPGSSRLVDLVDMVDGRDNWGKHSPIREETSLSASHHTTRRRDIYDVNMHMHASRPLSDRHVPLESFDLDDLPDPSLEHVAAKLKPATMRCVCEHFPMQLTGGCAFGDAVVVELDGHDDPQPCFVLWFAPMGTKWAEEATRVVGPWSKSGGDHAPCLSENSLIVLPAIALRAPTEASQFRFKYRDLRAVPEASVQRHWMEDLSGRTVRAPQRYEPARLAASRLITRERRRECFEQTVKRQHRCFCCLALLKSSDSAAAPAWAAARRGTGCRTDSDGDSNIEKKSAVS